MFHYPYTKSYSLDKLTEEISGAGIPMISMDLLSPTQFVINTAVQLSNSQVGTLNAVVAAHIATSSLQDQIANRILAARNFGIRLIALYGAQNILSGYNLEQIQFIMEKTAKVQAALNTGSLYVAISELNLIEPDGVLITTEKIKSFRNLIEDYLQIPRT